MNASILHIRLYGDPVLRKRAKPVRDIGPAERILIQSMIDTLHEAKGVGLAAVQVGIERRIFVVDLGEGPMAFINPQVIRKSGNSILEEGCLSIPGINVDIKRPIRIVLRYFDENGKRHERSFEELLARIILHENDHLNGRMIVDYASFGEKRKMRKQLKELAKEANKK